MTRQLSARLTRYAVALFILFVSAATPSRDGSRPDEWGVRVVHAAPTTITVTTTQDELNGDTSSFEDLIDNPGGAGISLREAITAANAMPPGPRLFILSQSRTLIPAMRLGRCSGASNPVHRHCRRSHAGMS
jgi:CSLREA domain-containing protein